MALNNVPLSGQNLDQTRDPIRNNFQFINNGFAVNHIPLNSGANSGKHTYVTYPGPVADPVLGANEVSLYVKNSAGASNIFLKKGVAAAYDITSINFFNVNKGSTKLPSGLIFAWGIQSGVSLDLATAFPGVFTTFYSVQTTSRSGANYVPFTGNVGLVLNFLNPGNVAFNFLVIGV